MCIVSAPDERFGASGKGGAALWPIPLADVEHAARMPADDVRDEVRGLLPEFKRIDELPAQEQHLLRQRRLLWVSSVILLSRRRIRR